MINKTQEIIDSVRDKINLLSINDKEKIYKEFVDLSTLLEKLTILKIDIDNIEKSVEDKKSRKSDILYLLLFILSVSVLYFVDKIEITVLVMFIYFIHHNLENTRKYVLENLLLQKKMEFELLGTELLRFRVERTEMEDFLNELQKNPFQINSYTFFYKKINSWIFNKILEEKNTNSHIEYLLNCEKSN
jgi:hypothetical protein